MAATVQASIPLIYYLHFPPHSSSQRIRAWGNRSLAWTLAFSLSSSPSAGIKIQYGWGRDNGKTGSPALAINPFWHVSWGQGFVTSQCSTYSMQNNMACLGISKADHAETGRRLRRKRERRETKTSVFLTCCLPLLFQNVTTERKGKEKEGFSGSSCQDVSDKTDKRWQRTELEFYIISFTLRRKKNIYAFNVFAQGLVPVRSSHLICRAELSDTAM